MATKATAPQQASSDSKPVSIWGSAKIVVSSTASIVSTTAQTANDIIAVNGKTAVNLSRAGMINSFAVLDEAVSENKITLERVREMNDLCAAMM